MLTIDQPITIATKRGYEINNVNISLNQESKEWFAVVSYVIKNEIDEVISNGVMTYYGEEFNQWFADFTTGAYLYHQLIEKEQLDVVLNDAEVEEMFINKVVTIDTQDIDSNSENENTE